MKHRISAVALVALTVSGCGVVGGGTGAGNQGSERNVDMQQASDRADEILDATLAAVRPGVEARRGPSTDSICTDFKNDATGAGQVVRRRYVVTVISPERRGSFVGVVERHWKAQGYEITAVRPNKEMPAVFANAPEGFQLTVEIGYKGQAFFTVASNCVTESEVVEPDREPFDPDSPEATGLPYIESPFWSAGTPVPSPSGGAG